MFGGCFDKEFDEASLRFFEQVREGDFILLVSDVMLDELDLAPDAVRAILAGIDDRCIERVTSTPASEALDDARHIAVATMVGADIVASWNFKHIVHFEKIMGFEGINLLRGHKSPRIHSPRELIEL